MTFIELHQHKFIHLHKLSLLIFVFENNYSSSMMAPYTGKGKMFKDKQMEYQQKLKMVEKNHYSVTVIQFLVQIPNEGTWGLVGTLDSGLGLYNRGL